MYIEHRTLAVRLLLEFDAAQMGFCEEVNMLIFCLLAPPT